VSRPRSLVVVAGTGTAVGKTWVSTRVLRALRDDGRRVAARKPAQSYDPAELGRTDAELLAQSTDVDPFAVCPPRHWYDVPMAPPMAAEVLDRPVFTIADLVAGVEWPDGLDVGLVELAGGPRSPMAADGDGVDLVEALAPDLCVLVADADLGTLNSVRLCARALATVPLIVFVNWYDDAVELQRRNVAWLRDRDGLEVLTDLGDLASRLLHRHATGD
jgi:dethiobiotin synthetase